MEGRDVICSEVKMKKKRNIGGYEAGFLGKSDPEPGSNPRPKMSRGHRRRLFGRNDLYATVFWGKADVALGTRSGD